MNVLCLSLGHNSSAVFISGTEVVGYETERLTRVKSDSAFPMPAIQRILEVTTAIPDKVFISHWFDNFDAYSTENKYYSARALKELFPDTPLFTCRAGGTSHHDAHALSAQAFAGKRFVDNSTLTIVVDGFGNGQEVASAYRGERLVSRVTGYFHSMGLLYQHAAEACGMDGQNDVYKFLGYRVHLKPCDTHECDKIAKRLIDIMKPAWTRFRIDDPILDPLKLFDSETFFHVKELHMSLFRPLIDKDDMYDSRVRIGYVVQEVLEQVIMAFIKTQCSFDKIILAGGCFLNVRLNDKIRRQFGFANVCVMPLAGDQGAALGLAHRVEPLPEAIFSSLCWGPRRMDAQGGQTIKIVPFDLTTIEMIGNDIAGGKIVNLVYGAMEFGPRALCHTSSLALPTRELVDAINVANGRTTVMPMAPVMLYETGHHYFSPDGLARTHKSDAFMITAHDYIKSVTIDDVEGVAHCDIDGTHSGRPQFVDCDEGIIGPLLEYLEINYGINVLVNTSLNIHGEPIVYDIDSLIVTTSEWMENCPVPFSTYIVKDRP